MAVTWRDTTLMRKVKIERNYVCEECGSTKDIQAHHYDGHDNDKLIVLCGKCHASKHSELAPGLFTNKKEIRSRQLGLGHDFARSRPWVLFNWNGDRILKKYQRIKSNMVSSVCHPYVSPALNNMLDCSLCNEVTKHWKVGQRNDGLQRYKCSKCGTSRYM